MMISGRMRRIDVNGWALAAGSSDMRCERVNRDRSTWWTNKIHFPFLFFVRCVVDQVKVGQNKEAEAPNRSVKQRKHVGCLCAYV